MKNPIIIVLFFYQIVCANSSVDSLESYLKVVSDSQKVEIYQELAAITSVDSFEQSIEYSEHAYVYAQLINDELQAANILFNIAQFCREKELYEKSKQAYIKSTSLFTSLKNNRMIAYSYAMLGVINTNTRNFSIAEELFTESISICSKFNLLDILAFCFSYIGNINYERRNFNIALIYYKKALFANFKNSFNIGIATNYYSIGSVFNALNHYDQAIDFYLKALTLEQESQNFEGIAMIYHAMGIVYDDLQNYIKALEYNLLALRYKDKFKDKKFIISCYNSLGLNFFSLGKISKSKYYLKEAEHLSILYNYKQGQILTYNNWGKILKEENYCLSVEYMEKAINLNKTINDKWLEAKILIDLGSILRDDNKKKIKLLKKGISIAKKIKTKDLLVDAYLNIAKIYRNTGQYKKAYQSKVFHTNLKNSIQIKSVHKIADMQLRYETAKREKVNDNLQKENQLQKIIIGKHKTQQWLLYASVMILSFLTIIGYFKFISKNKYGIKLYKRINKAMARHKEQEQSLIHLSALTKLGELAASIIHDLKQPLQDIKLSAEEIESGISNRNTDQKLIKSSLEDIFEDVERISSMADYVITCTNKKVYEKEIEFNVNNSIANAYRMIRKQLMRQEIMLNMDLEDNLPAVLGNPWKFEHVLLNIFSNSSHALNEIRKFNGGEFKENFVIETYSNMYNVFVRVKDNGIGVINSFKPKMFYPFATSKKPGEGTGLGLSIVYNVVRQMNGRLDFVSTPFVGTVITLIFPFASAKTIHHAKERTLLEEVENFSIR